VPQRAAPAGPTINVQMVDPSIEKGARFLDEVQEKAHERIVSAMLLEVPAIGIHAVAYECARSVADQKMRHRLAFIINGQQFDLDVSHEEFERPEAMVKLIVDTIATEITSVAMRTAPLMRQHYAFKR
jgi:hypothetical protein